MRKEFENMFSVRDLANEVKHERDTIKKIREEIENILQEDFDGIYVFFQNLFKNNYDIIVLMSRRCLVLCQIFMRFFILDDGLENNTTKVVSDQAIPYYMDDLNGNKIVIVDDILIHGRTIRKLYRFIKEKCDGLKPDIFVYMADTDIDCLSDELKRKVQSECVANKGEWRSLSNKIVCSIFAANEPYTSFVSSYYGYGDKKIIDTLDENENLETINITGQMQKCYGVTAKFMYEPFEERRDVFKWLSEGEGIRVYWNERILKYTFIPYVFVRYMNLSECVAVCDKIADALPACMLEIKKILKKKSDMLIEYKMRLLTCILSNVYWIDFKDRYQLAETVYIDSDTLNSSFGNRIADELENLNCENSKAILLLCGRKDNDVPNSISELYDILSDECLKEGKQDDLLKCYFQKAWLIDEYRALHTQERYIGLLLETFIKMAEERYVNKNYLLANMIYIWDNGLATANYAVDVEKGIVGCYITPGEQSYKIILEKYPFLMMKLVFVSKLIKRNDKEISNEDYTNYRIDILLKLVEEYHKKYVLPDYKYICDIIKYEKGYLNAWNQSAIIRNALQYDEKKDEKLVEQFIQENL